MKMVVSLKKLKNEAKPPRSTNGSSHIRETLQKSKRIMNAVKFGVLFDNLCDDAEDVIHQLVYDPQEKKSKNANESNSFIGLR
jgi:hypothetical protein